MYDLELEDFPPDKVAKWKADIARERKTIFSVRMVPIGHTPPSEIKRVDPDAEGFLEDLGGHYGYTKQCGNAEHGNTGRHHSGTGKA